MKIFFRVSNILYLSNTMLILFGIVIIALSTINYTYAQNNVCQVSEFEQNIAQLVGTFGLKEIKFAENEKEMNDYCRKGFQSFRDVKQYLGKCVRGIYKTLLSVTAFSSYNAMIKQNCNNKIDKQKFISRSKCGNRGKNGTAKCWNKLIFYVSNIRNVSEPKQKIPLMCCQFYEWRTCTLNIFRRLGSSICSENDIEGHTQLISRGSLDPMNVFCGDWNDDSDKCQKLLQISPKPKYKRLRDKTPFSYLSQIFESL